MLKSISLLNKEILFYYRLNLLILTMKKARYQLAIFWWRVKLRLFLDNQQQGFQFFSYQPELIRDQNFHNCDIYTPGGIHMFKTKLKAGNISEPLQRVRNEC